MEEAARKRSATRSFCELCASGKVSTIATAHTLSDQAETVLMKLLRGAWTEGIGAIHPVLELAPKGRVVRPLLDVTREEIEVFLKEQNQTWREDASNTDAAYTRNRIRHVLLPALRAENPKLDTTLANLAEVARAEQAHWQGELARLLPQVLMPGRPVRGGGRVATGTACVAIRAGAAARDESGDAASGIAGCGGEPGCVFELCCDKSVFWHYVTLKTKRLWGASDRHPAGGRCIWKADCGRSVRRGSYGSFSWRIPAVYCREIGVKILNC